MLYYTAYLGAPYDLPCGGVYLGTLYDFCCGDVYLGTSNDYTVGAVYLTVGLDTPYGLGAGCAFFTVVFGAL